jgi:hypothetical protein
MSGRSRSRNGWPREGGYLRKVGRPSYWSKFRKATGCETLILKFAKKRALDGHAHKRNDGHVRIYLALNTARTVCLSVCQFYRYHLPVWRLWRKPNRQLRTMHVLSISAEKTLYFQ